MVEVLNRRTMTTTEKKKRLDNLLANFDWYYQRTEDRRVYHYWSRVNGITHNVKAYYIDFTDLNISQFFVFVNPTYS